RPARNPHRNTCNCSGNCHKGFVPVRHIALPIRKSAVQHLTGNAIVLNISKAALIAAAISLTAVPAGLFTATTANAALVTTNAHPANSNSASSEEPSSPGNDTTTSTSGFTSNLSIPTITLVDSSMDEAALRDALSGGFSKHVQEIANLNATSITIPEVT